MGPGLRTWKVVVGRPVVVCQDKRLVTLDRSRNHADMQRLRTASKVWSFFLKSTKKKAVFREGDFERSLHRLSLVSRVVNTLDKGPDDGEVGADPWREDLLAEGLETGNTLRHGPAHLTQAECDDSSGTYAVSETNHHAQGWFRGLPCSNDQIKEGLNSQLPTQRLLNTLQNLELDDASDSTSDCALTEYFETEENPTHPSKIMIHTPEDLGLMRICAGKHMGRHKSPPMGHVVISTVGVAESNLPKVTTHSAHNR